MANEQMGDGKGEGQRRSDSINGKVGGLSENEKINDERAK